MIESGKVIVIVGRTGSGKSSCIKELIDEHEKRVLIFDVNNEYGEHITDSRRRVFNSEESFINTVEKSSNIVAIFEEATIYLSSQQNTRKIRDILVKKRHRNHCIIFVFHSIARIPLFLFDFIDKVIMLETLDNLELIKKNRPSKFIEGQKMVRTMAKYSRVVFRP